MSRLLRMLQTGAVLCLLSGCASQSPALTGNKPGTLPGARDAATIQADTSHKTTGTTRLQPDNPASFKTPAIQAGSSHPGATGFTQKNGQLKPDIQAYAVEVAHTRNIPQREVELLLKAAQYNATVARLMAPPKTRIRRSWSTYRQRFVEPVRLKAGVEFWQRHAALLDQTERDYGVPSSIIVAIIGVETIYGRYMGDFRVLDALSTLGFRYPDASRPERSQLFRDQLADLIQLHHQHKLDAYSITGSYAGAMGLPQFMPGSLLRYAVNGDNNPHIDLFNPADAIPSVASFLRHHGWQPGLPIFAPVQLSPQAKKLVDGAIDPSLSWQTLINHGATAYTDVNINTSWQHHLLGVVNLIDEPRNTTEYHIGTPNFFAITHYNRSYFYAASVAELAAGLAQRMGKPTAGLL